MPLKRSSMRRDLAITIRDNTQSEIALTREIRTGVVQEKLTDGMARVVARDGQCSLRSTSGRGARVGDGVSDFIGFSAQTGSTGASSSILSGSMLWLDAHDPTTLQRDETTPVTYFGGGFTEGLWIQYLKPRSFWADPEIPEINPNFIQGDITIISPLEATADVFVVQFTPWPDESEEIIVEDLRYGIGVEPEE